MRWIAIVVAVVASVIACGGSDPSPAGEAPSTPDAGIATDTGSRGGASDPSDAGAPDALMTDGASTDGRSPYDGPPIESEPGKWTWVSFPESSCANGSPAGFGINRGTSHTLFFYLEGGGACWDEGSCFGIQPTAIRMSEGVGEADIESLSDPKKKWTFNRDYQDNVFKDASFVYVPYCTGDVHAGAREQTYGKKTVKHFGRKNIEAFLERLVPTFKSATRVVLSGSSAGGFGAYLNFLRVQEAFGAIRVDLIDDSGQPFPKENIKLFSTWSDAWDLAGNFPTACVGCNDSFDAALPYYLATYPSSKFALLSFTMDATIAAYFQTSLADFKTSLLKLAAAKFDGHPNAKYFFIGGVKHTLLGDLAQTSNGTTLGKWLTDMQTDSPSWQSTKP